MVDKSTMYTATLKPRPFQHQIATPNISVHLNLTKVGNNSKQLKTIQNNWKRSKTIGNDPKRTEQLLEFRFWKMKRTVSCDVEANWNQLRTIGNNLKRLETI